MGQGVHVAAKLNVERLIQPQLLANVLHDVVAGAVAGQQTGRIAGDQVRNNKSDNTDTGHHQE